MEKGNPNPECFGKMLKGNVYAERCCNDCPVRIPCEVSTKSRLTREKKQLDPRWVDELIDMCIGPQLVTLSVKSIKAREGLLDILRQAVTEFYERGDWKSDPRAPLKNQEEFVRGAGDIVYQLYANYAFTRLLTLFREGMPDPKKIVVMGQGPGKIKIN